MWTVSGLILSTCLLSCSAEVCTDIARKSECLYWDTILNDCEKNAPFMAEKCPVRCSLCGPCSNKPCASDQKCISQSKNVAADYNCTCADGYAGSQCSDSPCTGVEYCLNGGTCIVDYASENNYTCSCRSGFTGSRCQECIDDDGSCSWWASTGECQKNPGFMQTACRVSCPDGCPACIRTPCRNGGICDGSDVCNCTGTGFSGDHCEVNNKCIPSPCQNGGNCTQLGTCDCTNTGFTGDYCEVQICDHEMTLSRNERYREVPVPDIGARSSLVFTVRTCKSARLALSSGANATDNVAEIVIGALNNTVQAIRNCTSGCLLAMQGGSFLSCDDFKTFWVTWDTLATTVVTLGTGAHPGTNAHVSADLLYVLPVQHISVATGDVAQAMWTFDFTQQTNPAACSTTTPLPITTETTVTTTSVTSATIPPFTTESTVITTEAPTTTPETTVSTPTTEKTTTEPSTKPSTTEAPSILTTTSPSAETTASSTATSCTPKANTSSPTGGKQTPKCHCAISKEEFPEAMAKAEQAAVEIKKNLTITEETSAQKRTKISAEDPRPSAQAVGQIAIVILLLVVIIVVVPDLISVWRWLDKVVRGRRMTPRGISLEESLSGIKLAQQNSTRTNTVQKNKDFNVSKAEDQKNNFIIQRNQLIKVMNVTSNLRRPLTRMEKQHDPELDTMTLVELDFSSRNTTGYPALGTRFPGQKSTSSSEELSEANSTASSTPLSQSDDYNVDENSVIPSFLRDIGSSSLKTDDNMPKQVTSSFA